MRRRDVIPLIGSVIALPLAVRAQQAGLPVIGFLSSRSPDESANEVAAFRQGLRESGFVEKENVVIDFRWAEGVYSRLPELASDLVNHRVKAIAAISPPAARAAKAATATIPIVFQSGADPVTAGLVSSLNRPSENLTGFYRLVTEFVPKCLELLRQVLPKSTLIALLVNPTNKSAIETQLRDAQTAASSLGLELQILSAGSAGDLDRVFASLSRAKIDGLVIGTDSFFIDRSKQLAALTLRYAMPAIGTSREFARAGGLMSYDASLADQYRQVGGYIGRILKGEKPGELPVQQATKYELIFNRKTAQTFGLKVPDQLLAIADEVIE